MSVKHLKDLPPDFKNKSIAVDSNILIQLCDDQHQHNRNTTRNVTEIMHSHNVRFVYFLATKLEIQDYFRKAYLTRAIKGLVQDNQFAGGKGILAKACSEAEALSPAAYPDWSLQDRDIKKIRNACFQEFSSIEEGVKRWRQICQFALGATLPRLEANLEKIGIQYISGKDQEFFSPQNQPDWDNQEALVKSWGLGSSDAAIFNMALTSPKVEGIFTNDWDMIVLCQSQDYSSKIKSFTLLPEFLHKRTA